MNTKHVLITGANRGIGFALVNVFFQSGDWEIYATCRHPEQANELQSLARDSNGRIAIHALDVTDQKSVSLFSKKIADEKIDLLINNAGIMGGDQQSAFDMDFDSWLNTFAVNSIAPLRVIQAVIDNLRRSDNPKIITISSQMGALNRKSTGSYAYRSSKAAVNKVMQTLALELEKEGIIVCPMHPGWVKTDMGGAEAEISAKESAAGILKTILSLKLEHSGRFWQWNGEEHPW